MIVATQMLDSGIVDLVVVSTPPNTHYEWAKAALSRGVHVMQEQPVHPDEMLSLLRVAKMNRVLYAVNDFYSRIAPMRR